MTRQAETDTWEWEASAKIGRWITKSQAVRQFGVHNPLHSTRTVGASLGKSTSPSKPILRDVTSRSIISLTTVTLRESCCLFSKVDAVASAFAGPSNASRVEALTDSNADPISS